MRYKQNPPPKVDIDPQTLQKKPMKDYIEGIPGYQEAKKRNEDANMDNVNAMRSAWKVGERKVNNSEHCRYCGK